MSSPTNRPSSPPFPARRTRHGNPSSPPTAQPYRSCLSHPAIPCRASPPRCDRLHADPAILLDGPTQPMTQRPCHSAPPTRQPDPSCPERPGPPAADARATSKGKRSGTAAGGADSGAFADRTAPARRPPFRDPSPIRPRTNQSLRLSDPLTPCGFHRQPPRLRTVLPRVRGCPPHSEALRASCRPKGASVAGASRRTFPGLVGGNGPSFEQRRQTMQNIVILAGTIRQAPETRTTRSGTDVTRFKLVTSRPLYSEAESSATRPVIGSRTRNGTASSPSTGWAGPSSNIANPARRCWCAAASTTRNGRMRKVRTATAARSSPRRWISSAGHCSQRPTTRTRPVHR